MTEMKMNAQQLVQSARLAEMADRMDDMKDFMRQLVVEKKGAITTNERELLSIAYKHVVGVLRGAYRSINSMETKYPNEKMDEELVDDYRKTIQKELTDICTGLLEMLDTLLLPNATTDDAKVFFLKMVGDYTRYMAESKEAGSDLDEMVKKSRNSYQQAMDLALQTMAPIEPIRLGLALNFSVFYYEIDDAPQEACQLARKAYNDAIENLAKVDEKDYKDTTLIMQLLRENLCLWNAYNDSGSEDEGRLVIDETVDDPTDVTKPKPKSPEVDITTSAKRSKSQAPEKTLKSPKQEKVVKEEIMELGGASEQRQKDEKAPTIPKEASPK